MNFTEKPVMVGQITYCIIQLLQCVDTKTVRLFFFLKTDIIGHGSLKVLVFIHSVQKHEF